jgi:diguanylate cyclase (GGDEF)-like protein
MIRGRLYQVSGAPVFIGRSEDFEDDQDRHGFMSRPALDPKLSAAFLPEITAALDSPAWVIPLPAELRAVYDAEHLALRRGHNRRIMIVMTIIFDLFWLAQLKSVPTLVLPSLVFRAGMTSLLAVFVALDRRDKLGRAYGPALVTLAVMATVISAVLCVMTPADNTTTMSDVRSIPLILMGTGLIARLTPAEVVCNAVISVAVFVGSVLIAPSVPNGELPSLILMDAAIGAGAVLLNLQLETRDRRVFLLQASDQINRAELVARNRGLLLETHTDGLTGVANRRCFDEVLAEAWRIAQEQAEPVGIIMIDIDHFKLFNDCYGHSGGDDCLRMVAAAARREARTSDLFARYGGEEFIVILPGAGMGTVFTIAERMRLAIEGMRLKHAGCGENGIVTASFGVASMVPGAGDGPAALLEAADSRLYAAKRAGRNLVTAA